MGLLSWLSPFALLTVAAFAAHPAAALCVDLQAGPSPSVGEVCASVALGGASQASAEADTGSVVPPTLAVRGGAAVEHAGPLVGPLGAHTLCLSYGLEVGSFGVLPPTESCPL